MAYIISINSKAQKYFKGCEFGQTVSDDGVVTHKFESGIVESLFRWATVEYNFTMQFMTHEQVMEIHKEILLSIRTDSSITLDYTKMRKAGRLNFEEVDDIDPIFYVDSTSIKFNRVPGTDFWNITMILEERVEAD